MLIIFTIEYPDTLTITSRLYKEMYHYKGEYKLDKSTDYKTAHLRKVYRKTTGNYAFYYFLFYSSKFCHDDNVGVKICIFSGDGWWKVGRDI